MSQTNPTPLPPPKAVPWLPEAMALAAMGLAVVFGALGITHPAPWVRVVFTVLPAVIVPTVLWVRKGLDTAAWLADLVQALQQALAGLGMTAAKLEQRAGQAAEHADNFRAEVADWRDAMDEWREAVLAGPEQPQQEPPLEPGARRSGLRGALPPLPPDQRIPVRYLHQYAQAGSPLLHPPAYPVDTTRGKSPLGGWQMLGNGPDPTLTAHGGQPVGDCVYAGRQHLRMLKALAYDITESWESADQLVTEYLQATGGQDTGVVIAEALHAWYQAGLVAGFAPVDLSNRELADTALGVFHGLLCGVSLTPDADDLFGRDEEWSVAQGQQPDPNEGHCIVQFAALGPSKADGYITWGAEQWATTDWTQACRVEAWAVITAEDAQAAQVDLAAMRADIDAWRGVHTP